MTTAQLTKAFQHICWDGCMFPNDVMLSAKTWRDVLSTMIAVRERARLGLKHMAKKESQRRACRLWLHGPDALECLPQGHNFFDLRIRPV